MPNEVTDEQFISSISNDLLSGNDLRAMVRGYVLNNAVSFKDFADENEPEFKSGPDYKGFTFGTGATYSLSNSFKNFFSEVKLPGRAGRAVGGYKLYSFTALPTVAGGFLSDAQQTWNDPEATDLDKKFAGVNFATGILLGAKFGLKTAPYVLPGHSDHNKLIRNAAHTVTDLADMMENKYFIKTDQLVRLQEHIDGVVLRKPIQFTVEQDTAFEELKSAYNDYKAKQEAYNRRRNTINTALSEIDQAANSDIFDSFTQGNNRSDIDAPTERLQSALKGTAPSSIEEPDSFKKLQSDVVNAGDALNEKFNSYTQKTEQYKDYANYRKIWTGSGAHQEPMKLQNFQLFDLDGLDLRNPKLDVDFDINSLSIKKPGVTGKTYAIGDGLVGLLANAGWGTVAAYDLHKTLNNDNATNSEKVVSGLVLSSAVLATTASVLDIVSVVAKSTKLVKGVGVAGLVVDAVSELVLGAAKVYATFSDPNATDLQKGLAIANLVTPGFDLLAIEKAISYKNLLDSGELSEADTFVYEGLYKEAVLNSIPLVNAFSFLWTDSVYKHAARRLIETYGDGTNIDDDAFIAFLDNALSGIIETYFEDNFIQLKDTLLDWNTRNGAQQLLYMGYGASYESLSAEARQIYDRVIPQALREQVQKISTLAIGIGDESLGDSELITRDFGEENTGQFFDGKGFYKHRKIEWNLGQQNSQPITIDTNVAIINVHKNFSGNSVFEDHWDTNNTVFYESSGDRDLGYTKEIREVEETRYRITYEPNNTITGISNKKVVEEYTVKVRRVFNTGVAGDALDHLKIGGGMDTVIVDRVDEILRVTSNDWTDFVNIGLESAEGTPDTNEMLVATQLAIPSIPSIDWTNFVNVASAEGTPDTDFLFANEVSVATLRLQADSDANTHRYDLHWQRLGEGPHLNRAELENVEAVGLNGFEEEQTTVFFRDDSESFNVYLNGYQEAMEFIISDDDISNVGRYRRGGVTSGDQADKFAVDLASITDVNIDSGGGNDNLSAVVGASQLLKVKGGEGFDSLSVTSSDGQGRRVYIGDKGAQLSLSQRNSTGGVFVDGVETLSGTKSADHLVHVTGEVNLDGGEGADVYEIILQQGADLVSLDDSDPEGGNHLVLNADSLEKLGLSSKVTYEGGEWKKYHSFSYDQQARVNFQKADFEHFTLLSGNVSIELNSIDSLVGYWGSLTVENSPQNLEYYDLYEGSSGNDLFMVQNPSQDVLLRSEGGQDRAVLLDGFNADKIDISGTGLLQEQGRNLVVENGTIRNYIFAEDGLSVTLSEFDRFLRANLSVNDTLNGNDGRDFIAAGGTGSITTGLGADMVYLSTSSASTTVLTDMSSVDRLVLSQRFDADKLAFRQIENDLVIHATTDEGETKEVIIRNGLLTILPEIYVGTLRVEESAVISALNLYKAAMLSGFDDALAPIPKQLSAPGSSYTHGSGKNDFIYTYNSNDEIWGYEGVDTIYGNGGNDIINGGSGLDVLDGGSGTDIASYAGSSYAIKFDLNGSQNEYYRYGGQWLTGDSVTNFEGVIGTDYADIIIGNDEDNILSGGKGVDTISGGQGNDIIHGGLGLDVLDGGSDIDIASYDGASYAIKFDLNGGQNEYYRYGGQWLTGDSVTNFEGVIGTDYADIIIGNSEANILQGNGGSDDLQGGAGNDEYRYRDGDGIDTISDSDGDNDKLILVAEENSTLGRNQIAFKMLDDDLMVSMHGNNAVRINNWNDKGRIEDIELDAGNGNRYQLSGENIPLLIQAMAAFDSAPSVSTRDNAINSYQQYWQVLTAA
ncbi:calcium-binding protein [Motiliproteus sp. MSK22-1]|uniref:calcium-binding protein n=1 Tax=Motiliproteus sp. MSK22-1 TaxID=1897630 RepID=UPI00097579AF|nr:calcium-binding protein [Motiliproteus sp. MSK22-1]OMH32781.1 hypothetical protein BGP75_14750 [Motiliproteus sp. MSK22-1]